MYPRRKDLFTAWSKAMVEGSTVDKPNYSPATAKSSRTQQKRRKRRRKRRKNNGKEK